jgi:hypothetical protein
MYKKIQAFLLILFCSSHLLFSLTVQQAAKPTPPKKYALSICAIFKDEAPWFKEWIEYHLLVGVDHFYLYNNDSTDNFREVLKPYIDDEIVTIIDWPNRSLGGWCYKTQATALADGCKRSSQETTWLALIDIDEFLLPVKETSMKTALKKYSDYPGLQLHWHFFGTSNIRTLQKNTLLIEALHRCSPLSEYRPPKTIVKPEMFHGFSWPPHKCTYLNGQKPLDVNKNELRVNHYVNRTLDYLQMKAKKKWLMEGYRYSQKEIEAGNQLEDQEKLIQRFIPELRSRMGFEQTNNIL